MDGGDGRRQTGRGKREAGCCCCCRSPFNKRRRRCWPHLATGDGGAEREREEEYIYHVRVSMSALIGKMGPKTSREWKEGKGAKVSGCHMCMIQWESAFNPGPRQAPNCWLALASFWGPMSPAKLAHLPNATRLADNTLRGELARRMIILANIETASKHSQI